MRNVGPAVLGIILTIAFVGAPLLHNVIPHSHGAVVQDGVYTHDGTDQHSHDTESPVWSSFHSALRHEDKKILLAILAVIAIAFFAIVWRITIVATVSLARLRMSSLAADMTNPNAGELLRRGVHRYRVFG